ncbi:hypothetical protein ANCCAN_10658 [Ancylostoma caninum]|uniref:NTR domain-containing protein n=1 Tax=Ancylostoma caninum TaxID=29170 RepID=A0A368GG15_ANCCA|nr:hypothetical protein ANCCAN_10658 [Ancylostoma caninum]
MSIHGDREKPEEPWTYTIWHVHTWKGYDKVKDNATSILTTSSSESACGQTGLMKEMDYFLQGKMEDNGEISITSCNLALPCYDVNEDDVNLLRDLRDEKKKCSN